MTVKKLQQVVTAPNVKTSVSQTQRDVPIDALPRCAYFKCQLQRLTFTVEPVESRRAVAPVGWRIIWVTWALGIIKTWTAQAQLGVCISHTRRQQNADRPEYYRSMRSRHMNSRCLKWYCLLLLTTLLTTLVVQVEQSIPYVSLCLGTITSELDIWGASLTLFRSSANAKYTGRDKKWFIKVLCATVVGATSSESMLVGDESSTDTNRK